MKGTTKKALEANGLIHDAILMGIADKYIAEESLDNEDYGLQLLGRALNWAVPSLNYNLDNDIAKVENPEFRTRLLRDENQIFKKGLAILNADPLIEKLITFYVTYEIHLVRKLFPKEAEKRYPGMVRLRKFTSQTLEEPNVEVSDFKENYKSLFTQFNSTYGRYGKTLKPETIDMMFSLL